MPTIHFMGYVEPGNLGLIVENLKPLTERDADTGYVTTFTVAIVDCIVSVECDIDKFRPDYLSNLYTRSLEMARTIEKLQGIFDSYEEANTDALFDDIVSDVDLFIAIDDLVQAISTPRVVATNCARVIDGIRFLIAPTLKDKAGWKVVHETLNIDESYLRHISRSSQMTRHGRHQFIASTIAEELIFMTSVVLNRYILFRSKYRSRLPPEVFPKLTFQTPHS